MKALLIDGLNLIRRIYAAVPGDQNSESHLESAINSTVSSLRRALNTHQPSHALVALEISGPNWRHRLYPVYKANRSAMPYLLETGMERYQHAFEQLGVTCLTVPGYEADDVLATVAWKISSHQGHTIILSTDRSYCQLLGPFIQVYDHFNSRFMDSASVLERFHVKPHQLPSLFALAGDSSLSIPGIKSIGPQTAAKLIHDYGDLEKILEASESIPGKLGSKLFAGKEIARLSYELFTLKKDINLGINLNQFRYLAVE